MYARFLYHKLPPPSPFKSIDTVKVARRYFNMNSNKLDDIGRYLGLGRKVVHTGWDLWKRCFNGDRSAWQEMISYNTQDVVLFVDLKISKNKVILLVELQKHKDTNVKTVIVGVRDLK